MNKKLLAKAFKDTIPVLSGYMVLGIGFGIILQKSGYGVWWALGMSAFIYAGSMQYAGISLMSGGASLITVALTTLTVNARHLFYGISMLGKYRRGGKNDGDKSSLKDTKSFSLPRWYLIFALTDETYSLVCKDPEGVETKQQLAYCSLVTLLNHCYWVTGSVIGSLLGSVIRFNTQGIDFALTALFVVVATDQWLNSKEHFPALGGAVISVLCLVLFGKDAFLIPAMTCIGAFLLLGRNLLVSRKMKDGEKEGDTQDE